MKDKRLGLLTPVLAAVTLVAWLALEFFFIGNGLDSISTQITAFFELWPMFGVLFALVTGLLLGHWFWKR